MGEREMTRNCTDYLREERTKYEIQIDVEDQLKYAYAKADIMDIYILDLVYNRDNFKDFDLEIKKDLMGDFQIEQMLLGLANRFSKLELELIV